MGLRLFPKQAGGAAERSSHRRTVMYSAASVAAGLLLAGVVGYRCAVRLNSSPGRVKLYQVTIGEGASARQIARQLEQNGIIKVRKRFVNRRPQTSYRLTDKGRQVFRDYVACMAAMVEEHSGAA